MSKVKVSHSRSWVGLIVTGVAVVLLATIILAGREPSPPAPTPVVQTEPNSTPTNETQTPSIEATPRFKIAQLPDAYAITHEYSAITLRDVHTGEQHYTFGVGDDFHYQAGHIIIHRDRNVRVIEFTTGHIRWEGEISEPFSILAGYIVYPEQNQFIVAEYIHPINSQLRFTTYELDSNQLLDQATFEIETGLMFIPGISSNGALLMYSQQELIRYDLATKTQTKLLLPELEGRSISAIAKHPREDTWYMIDDMLVVYQVNLIADREQVMLKPLTEPSKEKPFDHIDLVVNEQGLFFTATIPSRNTVLFYYDFLNGELSEREVNQQFSSLSPDFIGGGVWINDPIKHRVKYWDSQGSTSVKGSFNAAKMISVAPIVPSTPAPTTSLAASPPIEQQTQPDSNPFVWITETAPKTDESNSYTRHIIKALAPDGTQTTITSSAIAAFKRPNMAPLLLIQEQGYQIYDPEQQSYISIEESIPPFFDRSMSLQRPYVPDHMYTFNMDSSAIVWVGIDSKGFEQLIMTDVSTGIQTMYPLNLNGVFPINESLHLVGWHQSLIYFMHEGNQIWQLNLDDDTLTLLDETNPSFESVLYIPQSQQIVYVSTDLSNRSYITIYTISQNKFELISRFESISHLHFDPSTGLLSFIVHGDQEQATLMVQDSTNHLHFEPMYTIDSVSMLAPPIPNMNLSVDDDTLQLQTSIYLQTDLLKQDPGRLTHITTVDLEQNTTTQYFSTLQLLHTDQQQFLLKEGIYLQNGTFHLSIVRVPQNSTQPDIVLTIESSSFIDVFYIPQ